MIKTVYANIDATMYERTSSMNTGIDSILELSKVSSSAGIFTSRILIKFPLFCSSRSLPDISPFTGHLWLSYFFLCLSGIIMVEHCPLNIGFSCTNFRNTLYGYPFWYSIFKPSNWEFYGDMAWWLSLRLLW